MHLRYRFVLTDGTERTFEVELDPTSLALRQAAADGVPASGVAVPEWAALENEQCPNCPLRREDTAA